MKMRFLNLLVTTALACATNVPSPGGQEQAARELLELMQVERSMADMSTLMADAMVKQNPKMAIFRDVLIDWSNETMSWSEVEGRFVAIYVETFTERELRELITFYRTPTGAKSIQAMPELMQKGAAIGNEAAAAGMADLQERIRKRAAELDGKPVPPEEP